MVTPEDTGGPSARRRGKGKGRHTTVKSLIAEQHVAGNAGDYDDHNDPLFLETYDDDDEINTNNNGKGKNNVRERKVSSSSTSSSASSSSSSSAKLSASSASSSSTSGAVSSKKPTSSSPNDSDFVIEDEEDDDDDFADDDGDPRAALSGKDIDESLMDAAGEMVAAELAKDQEAVEAEKRKRFQLKVTFPNQSHTVMFVDTDTTVEQFTARVYAKVRQRLGAQSSENMRFRLPDSETALRPGVTLARVPYIKECIKEQQKDADVFPELILIGRGGADGSAADADSMASLTPPQRLQREIESLIGAIDSKGHEIEHFRCIARDLRKKVVAERRHDLPNSDCYVLKLPNDLDQETIRVRIFFTMGSDDVNSKTIVANLKSPIDHVMISALEKGYIKAAPSRFIFKVTGRAEYLQGNEPLIAYDYVRRCIKAGPATFVELSLVERSTVEGVAEPTMYERPEVEDAVENGDASSGGEVNDMDHAVPYEECSVSHAPWHRLKHISLWDIRRPFRVLICGVDGIPHTHALTKARRRAEASDATLQLSIVASLFHGGKLMAETVQSDGAPYSANPRWQEWLTFGIDVCDIPRSCRICFTLRADIVKKKDETVRRDKGAAAEVGEPKEGDSSTFPIGWVNCQLIDHVGYLRSCMLALRLWPDAAANPIGTCVENHVGTTALFLHFDSYARPVVFPHWTPPSSEEIDTQGMTPTEKTAALLAAEQAEEAKLDKRAREKAKQVRERIEAIIDCDPLYNLNEEEIDLLWENRRFLPARPKSLPKFLQAVAWNDLVAVQECHRMLAEWPKLAPLHALELLDAKYADDRARAYAIECLESISDIDLADVILQLTQVLKYEPYHDSALSRFLLSRALANPPLIGHLFFWHLKSEMHLLEIYERYGLLLEEYLRGCGRHRLELSLQNEYLQKFNSIADMIKIEPSATRLKVLRDGLDLIKFPEGGFKLPLNPKMQVASLNVPKCKYMDSKKRPLWLNFQNTDEHGAPILVIYKAGDDLRQDQLTLQMIRLMEKLWLANDLDLKLKPYGCISTGDEQGMIEVVLNSETTAGITNAAGGPRAIFLKTPIKMWLREHNKTEEEWNTAVDNFVHSCAGYCVATYVLGIGDRHNDNVMMTRKGHLFHIDFGHFLGNYKKKFGIKREKAPFIFTPAFAHAMGGTKSPNYKKFVDISCRAYNILRKHSNLFINLFAMMLSTGIPELTCEDDILYLREAFSADKSEKAANEKFKKLIKDSLNCKRTQLNDFAHMVKHS